MTARRRRIQRPARKTRETFAVIQDRLRELHESAREELAAIPLLVARVALARGPTLDADGKHRLARRLGTLGDKMYDAIARGEDPAGILDTELGTGAT